MRSLASSCSLNASASLAPPPVPLQSLLHTCLLKMSQFFIVGKGHHVLLQGSGGRNRGDKAVWWVRLGGWRRDAGGGGEGIRLGCCCSESIHALLRQCEIVTARQHTAGRG